jgi:hypothetical protein
VANRAPSSRGFGRRAIQPVERALMLIALGLDPRFDYTDPELHGAWRRRIAVVHPDTGGNAVAAAAIDVAYISLADRVETPHPVDVRL